MARQTKNKIFGVIAWALLLLLLIGVFSAILHFAFGDSEDLPDFFDTSYRVEYNGVNYTGTDNKISLPKGKRAKFVVKGARGYTVSIAPNVTEQTNFIYTVDGVDYKYDETNLTKAFLSQENAHGNYFELHAFDSYSLENVLSKLYEGKTVVVYDSIAEPYLLSITSGSITISFSICVDSLDIDSPDVVLDHDYIVF